MYIKGEKRESFMMYWPSFVLAALTKVACVAKAGPKTREETLPLYFKANDLLPKLLRRVSGQ